MDSVSTPELEEETRFRLWYLARRGEWLRFKNIEGSMLTFTEYLTARSVYLEEKKNG